MFRAMVRALVSAAFIALVVPMSAAAFPLASATATPDRGGAPLTVSFDASASSGADAYDWDFGDGTTGAGIVVSHEYSSAGSFVATLRG
jgi:PKD repeat protein